MMIDMETGGVDDPSDQLVAQGEQRAAKYGFWADDTTFILDPPRRHLSDGGVSVVRRLTIDAGIISDAGARTLRMIRSSIVLDMVADTEPAVDLKI